MQKIQNFFTKKMPKSQEPNLYGEIVSALVFASIDKVSKLISSGRLDVNAGYDDSGNTFLILACNVGKSIEIVKLLLDTPEIDVNVQNKNGKTALMLAANNKETEVVKLLLKAPGMDVNIQDKDGDTVLMYSAMYGCESIVKLLLDAPGIDVNVQNKNGMTALMWAANNKETEVVKLLLDAPGINVNVPDIIGNTALMYGSIYGFAPIVKLLLDTPGIDVNLKSIHGNTASDYMYVILDQPDTQKQIADMFFHHNPHLALYPEAPDWIIQIRDNALKEQGDEHTPELVELSSNQMYELAIIKLAGLGIMEPYVPE
jgi:ankyrin repeat protein